MELNKQQVESLSHFLNTQISLPQDLKDLNEELREIINPTLEKSIKTSIKEKKVSLLKKLLTK